MPETASLSPPLKRGLRHATHAATRLLQRRARVARLVRHCHARLREDPRALRRVRADLRTLLRLVRAWIRREYRVLPWRSLLLMVAALVYFVNPADVVPDALVGLGLVDDAAVISAVARTVRDDLLRFRQWEQATLREDGSKRLALPSAA